MTESWENPFDVSKGHRGFIDGDFVMLMYAWSPNWKQNTVGNDHYNLYVRRSFDGGLTWTTLPASYTHWDGTTAVGAGTYHCENYGYGNTVTPVCTTYAPGEFEQAWNVSQLIGNKVTILDPRYTPSGGPKALPDILTNGVLLYPDDERDPSKFFIVYETGDNTTVAEGEAVPLDLFYSRGTTWGDVYDVVEWYNQNTGETEERWDWLENDREDLSGEASVWANPGGTFFYAVWNQWQEPEPDVLAFADAWFRRVMYIDTLDAVPTASILFTTDRVVDISTGNISFFGTAVDNDHLGGGILAYQWRSDRDGVLSNQKSFTRPASNFSLGFHTIYFSAQDNEGNWSKEVSTNLFVVETLNQLFLPSITQ